MIMIIMNYTANNLDIVASQTKYVQCSTVIVYIGHSDLTFANRNLLRTIIFIAQHVYIFWLHTSPISIKPGLETMHCSHITSHDQKYHTSQNSYFCIFPLVCMALLVVMWQQHINSKPALSFCYLSVCTLVQYFKYMMHIFLTLMQTCVVLAFLFL